MTLHVRCPKCETILSVAAVPEAPRPLITPRPLPPAERKELARWRVWAADVRDRVGWHAGASDEVVDHAKTLCKLLDLWDHRVALAFVSFDHSVNDTGFNTELVRNGR